MPSLLRLRRDSHTPCVFTDARAVDQSGLTHEHHLCCFCVFTNDCTRDSSGLADTAIGGQRIEEFMNNATYTDSVPCPADVGGTEVKTAWNGQLFAKQVMPFVDMTVKGWTWCVANSPQLNTRSSQPLFCAAATLCVTLSVAHSVFVCIAKNARC